MEGQSCWAGLPGIRRGLMVTGGAWWAVSRVAGAGLLEGGRGSVPPWLASAVAAGSVRPSPSREGRGRLAGAGLGSSGARSARLAAWAAMNAEGSQSLAAPRGRPSHLLVPARVSGVPWRPSSATPESFRSPCFPSSSSTPSFLCVLVSHYPGGSCGRGLALGPDHSGHH